MEPLATITSSVMGYKTTIAPHRPALNRQGRVETVGEEVLSTYWSRADATKPVTVRQLAAYHTQGNTATIRWHQRGSTTLNTIFTHAGIDGQTLLPRLNGSTTAPAAGSFSPTGAFGFKIDTEWSDDALNDQTADRNNGCPAPCGHHVRFWPARDRAGAHDPRHWIIGDGLLGHQLRLQRQRLPRQQHEARVGGTTLHRLDVAGYEQLHRPARLRLDAGHRAVLAVVGAGGGREHAAARDRQHVRRPDLPDLPRQRRHAPAGPLSYALPTGTATRVDVRLHFAERYSGNNAAGRRVMDILPEGVLRVSNFDIFARAGGLNKAYVLALDDIAVRTAR